MKFRYSLFLILTFAVLYPSKGYAQKRKKKKFKYLVEKYSEFLHKDSDLTFIDIYRTIEKIDDEYVLKKYNPDKLVITNHETYSDKKLTTLNGVYKEWYDNGNRWKEGEYKNNEKTGKWYFYSYPNGKLNRHGHFKNGMEEGKWNGIDTVGRVKSEYNFKKGKLDGDYFRFDTTGTVFYKKVYENGVEISDEVMDSIAYLDYSKRNKNADEMAILKKCADVEEEERKKCSDSEYLRYVYGNISYPENARQLEIEGKAIIRFLINKDGKVVKPVAMRGICDEIEEECMRIINQSPDWIPAMNNGKPVNMYFNLPVKFKLE